MVKNEDVVKAWKGGIPSKLKSIHTDGRNLYSYKLLIGRTVKNKKVVIDYTKGGGAFKSATTSTHVGIAKRYASRTVKP